eukprot:SAG31_NODE_10708_length_1108_cov_0.850347_1_plen_106_part_10
MVQGGLLLGFITAIYQFHDLHTKWQERTNREKAAAAMRERDQQRDFKEVVQFSLCILESSSHLQGAADGPSSTDAQHAAGAQPAAGAQHAAGARLRRIRSLQSPLH